MVQVLVGGRRRAMGGLALAAIALAAGSLAPGVSASPSRLAAPTPPTRAAELPGGGTEIFAGKTYIALYGHPGTRALGVLGEQGTAATIRRAKKVAASYRPHTGRRVVPALEIIATVASRSAGADGDYSAESSVAKLRPLVDAAGRAGTYEALPRAAARAARRAGPGPGVAVEAGAAPPQADRVGQGLRDQ